MRASRYAEYEWHKRQHGNARRKLEALAGQLGKTGGPGFSQSLDSLAEWLTLHIGIADRMASAHLRNHVRERGSRTKTPSPKAPK
jgi:hemerythrin